MKIGIPTEIKNNEYRVSVVPDGVAVLQSRGHEVFVQKGAGAGSGITDDDYARAGATIVDNAAEIWNSEMVVKVKEPLEEEYKLIKKDQLIYTYFHFASSEKLLDACLAAGCTAVAYETIRTKEGELPLLTPMSEIAGRMAVQEGAYYLKNSAAGRGILLGGVPGVRPAKVTIIGGGVVGTEAAKMAAGLGADVTVLDVNLKRLRYLDDVLAKNVTTLFSNQENIRESVINSDLLIAAVLLQGARAPILVNRELVSQMKQGSVIVDVAVDQGGCIETCRPTTHDQPIFIEEGVLHYCVANIPGVVSRTSTFALTNATQAFMVELADFGWKKACDNNNSLKQGVNVQGGKITNKAVADSFNRTFVPLWQ